LKRGWIYKIDQQQNVPVQTGVVAQKASGKTVQAYFIIPESSNSASKNEVRSIEVNGGIGAELRTSNGVSLKFIAQQQAGKSISAAGLETFGRIKVSMNDTDEVIEIAQ